MPVKLDEILKQSKLPEKKKDCLEFFIQGGGDMSVGIPDADAYVMIKENYNPDEERVKEWKETLAEQYDVSMVCVQTKEEHDADIKREKEMEEDYFKTLKEES